MQNEHTIEPNLKSLFIRSLELKDADLRRKYLDEVCADNIELREEIERLLGADSMLDSSPLERVERWLKPFQLSVELEDTDTKDGFEPPRVIGPYELLETIGEGGMGTVFLARQSQPVCRDVALKLIKPGMDSREVLARFEAEMQTLGMMQHPNIASVLHAGLTPEGRPYFVMELVRGLPIDKHCEKQSVTLRSRLELFISVCQAVQHAHNRGVIHRDLKPSNVLVQMQDGVPVVKVIDFGIAKALSSAEGADQTRLTKFAHLVGTPLYMSPEQICDDARQVDVRSDIYSLGVLLYELVTGSPLLDRKVFQTASVAQLKRIICEEVPERPSQRFKLRNEVADSGLTEKKIGRELDWIILRALEKEPERRFQSATDLAEDLQRYLDGNAVQAGPPSIAYRLQSTMRKHRWSVVIGMAFLTLFTVAGIVSLSLYLDAQSEKRISELREKQASELREANILQSAIRAMASQDLTAMSEYLINGEEQSLAQSGEQEPRSLARLLEYIANPKPLASSLNSSPIRGLAISTATNEVFGVDKAGRVFASDLSLNSPIHILGQHSERGDSISVSPDGTKLVSGSFTGQVWLWDVATKQLSRKLAPLPSGVQTLVWSPDGLKIAAGGRYSEFVVYDSAGEEMFRHANDHRHESMIFSPDSQQLIVPTRENLEVWDITSRKLLKNLDTDRISNVRSMCWGGPDGRWLIAGERFSEGLVVIDPDSGRTLGSFNVGAQYAYSISGSPDGRSIAAAYSNGRVQLIRVSKMRSGEVSGEVALKFSAHQYTEEENSPALVTWIDRYTFVTAGADGAIKIWDAGQLPVYAVLKPPRELIGINWLPGRQITRYFSGDTYSKHPSYVSGMVASKNRTDDSSVFVPNVFDYAAVGNRMAAAGENRIGILTADTQQWLTCFDSPMASHHYITLSRDGTHLVASSDSQICVWRTDDDWKTHKLIQSWPFQSTVKPVFSNDMKSLFADNYEYSELLELDISTGRVLHRFLGSEHGNCTLDRSGKLLATASDRGIRVWALKDRSVVFEVNDVSQPLGFEFLDDSNVLVSGHLNGEVRAWHLPTQHPLGPLYAPSEWLGRPLAFSVSPDGSGMLIRYRNPAYIRPVFLGQVNLGRPSVGQ